MTYKQNVSRLSDEATEFGTDEVIYLSEVNEMIEDIESRVENAIKYIAGINGIDCIEECRLSLKRLLDDLY